MRVQVRFVTKLQNSSNLKILIKHGEIEYTTVSKFAHYTKVNMYNLGHRKQREIIRTDESFVRSMNCIQGKLS